MSHGHRHHEHPAVSVRTVEQIRKDPDFQNHYYQLRKENNDYDIPFIAGYSKDGKTLYYDRHLPAQITLHLDGHTQTIDPRDFIRVHESVEKSIIDSKGWGYYHAHAVAEALERRHLLEQLGPQWWQPYQHTMDQYAKADEHEKITSLPPDLDMTPYHASPVDKPLLRTMQRVMGRHNGRHEKEEVDYSEGMAKSHCGPVPEWPRGACAHFIEPNYCQEVRGYIGRKMWCKLWTSEK